MKQTRILILLMLVPLLGFSQRKKDKTVEKTYAIDKMDVSALKFRSVGPAMTSGRISDFAVHPEQHHVYYVATASGGVWKTVNSGTTYEPIFDAQGSYSIGCVTLAPTNPNIVWVGTGENNNQRSVAYGDGVYRSVDGGNSWEHMGLKASEHIGKIIVHPDDHNKVFVAAIGPLWNKGGDRGVYKTTDGGKTWKNVLEIDEHTGVTDIVMDPRDPGVLYAATFQRARHVYTYLGGGPGSSIYKSVDGGETWEKSAKGLPGVELGRIGLAISPADPEVIYAIVEAADDKGGFFRSVNRGASWEKRGGYNTSGNYYQEIICDPNDADIVYGMDTWMKVSLDGGKTFKNVGEDTKHVDNHCMWIDPNDTNHWLVGCDGGIYETWDAARTWAFKSNLPVTQFYKVAVDNDEPFYNIYGGTQDNFSLGGPSRTNTSHGIQNSDWYITHGGDGFESQIDPENPNIVYAQSQYGVLVRYDRMSGEEVGIQPKERKNENGYRWNWDAPLAVSHHASGRLYFAANKVFRSNDYGNSWDVISDDLTRQLDRNELKIMDRVWSMDAVAKNRSTSPYGTIVALSESPLNEDLIVIGTDDGLIQITTDGGNNWRAIDNIAGVPARTYVNAVYCSQHDANVIYAAFNHHKYGDFRPYMFKSEDMGATWTSISNNLPERGSVYAIEEDHVNSKLIFCGTEFGVFFSADGGERWKQLKAGVPTIAVRDLAIQRRENDLVLGTFGRGFYVLDDYTPLREISDVEDRVATIFPVRTALMFEKNQPLGLPGKAFQGDGYYSGEDLGPEAIITYYLKEGHESIKDLRKKKEKEEIKEGKDNAYPDYDSYKVEVDQPDASLVFTIMDASGKVVRKMKAGVSEGLHRISWDLRYASKDAISLRSSDFYNPFAGKSEGTLVTPGMYSVVMHKYVDNTFTEVGEAVEFEVKALDNTVLPADNREEKVAFQREVEELSRSIDGAQHLLNEMRSKMKHMRVAIERVESPMQEMTALADKIEVEMRDLSRALNGDPIKTKLDIDQPPTPATRVGWIVYEQKYSTSQPTGTHRMSLAIAKEEFKPILSKLQMLAEKDIKQLESMLEEADAPYTPGRGLYR